MLAIRKLFRGGRQPAPKGMAGKEICDRYDDANAIKRQWLSHLEEGYRYAIPHRNTFFNQNPGQKKNTDIFDSTAVLGVPSFATKMQSVLLPPWRHWSKLELGPEVPREQRETSRIAVLLQESTEVFFGHVDHSNMASQVHEAFQDLAIGTGCYDCLGGPLGGRALNFNAIPLAELTLEEGPQSTIETTYRDLNIAGRHIGRQWPGAQPGAKMAKLIEEKPSQKLPILEAVIYDPETGRWEGAAVYKPEKEVFWRASWRTNPRITFRWSVTPGEVYGRGPILQVLPDIKTANKVVEFVLRNAALTVAGMWTATTDAALNPFNFRIVPGAVVSVNSNDSRNPTIRALERAGDLRLGFEVLEQLQQTIKQALFQHLRDPAGPVRSATEIAIEERELVNQIGSSFGRLQTEVVESTVMRGTDVLSQRGAFPNIEIDGRRITLKHLSPLARAQDMDELMTLERTLEIGGAAGPEVLALGLKIEELAGWVAKRTGLDPRLIRDPGEKAQLQQKAAELIAQAQQAEAKAA